MHVSLSATLLWIRRFGNLHPLAAFGEGRPLPPRCDPEVVAVSRTIERDPGDLGPVVTMVVSSRKVEDRRRCRLFGTRPVSRDSESGREWRRCVWMRIGPSGCRDPEEEGTLHLYTAVA